jgi:protein-glutamine gamma-glutamyltransferase
MNPAVATRARLPRATKAIARRTPRDPITPRQVLWLAALIAAAQLPLVRTVPAWAAAAGMTLVALRLLMLQRDRMRPGAPPTRIPAWLLVACAAGVAATIKLSYGYFLGREPCIVFLYVLVAIKFLEARDPRDGALLVCLASFLVITPFFYSQSLLAALAAAPAILLIGAVHDVIAHRWPAAEATSWKAPLARASRLLLHGIPLAAMLFVLFPRLATPLWGLPADHASKTGLSDRMAPGMISELSLSDAIAFRVDFDDAIPTPRQRYWRGPVLSRFDGREWTQQRQRPDGTIARANTHTPSIGYTVALEPHDKPWLFALDLPSALPQIDVDPDTTGDLRTREVASLTRSQQLIARTLVTQPLRYRQRSILRDHYAAAALDAAENLQLPEIGSDRNPKTLAFARTLRADHPNDDDYIRSVLAWFTRESFVYTLAPPLLDRDPVDGFLFETRRGFCEHYAGAFVVLLRAAGIPARVVTGYQGGEINPRGGYMMVRQSDAHAWAEALVGGEWRRYDPTGAVAPSRIEMGLGGALPTSDQVPMLARLEFSFLKSLTLTWDAVNHGWRHRVIGFNYDSQRSLWRDLNVDRLAAWQLAMLIGAVALAWVGLVLGWLLWQRDRHDRARAHWHALCARLARAGLPRLPHEGPLDYARRAAARWPGFGDEFVAIGEAYAALRYGPDSTRADSDRQRAAALARLARAIRALPASSALRTQRNVATKALQQ